MSFPRYERYKESGVEWLGEVPEHWKVTNLGRLLQANDGGAWGDEPNGVNDTRVLRSTDQTEAGEWRFDHPCMRNLDDRSKKATLLVEGDLLVTKSSGSAIHIGKTSIVTLPIAALGCGFSNFMQRVRVNPDRLLPRLAWYLLNSSFVRYEVDLRSNSTSGLANVNAGILNALSVSVGEAGEQSNIVSFLDEETAKIDALIEEQRRLIELLKEKRQAVISHAVTKGLSPLGPTRDSGSEWIGSIPAHWVACPLRYRYAVELGKMLDEKKDIGKQGSPYLRNVDVQWDKINFNELPHMHFDKEDRDRFLLRGDDLLVCEGGELGRTAQVETDLNGIYYQKALHRLRPLDLALDHPRFMLYCMWDSSERKRFVAGQNKATIGHLPAEALRSYEFAFPPLAEQRQIASWLDDFRRSSDDLESKANAVVSLLQERRSALISVAVTGKIDVRNYAKQSNEEAA